MVDANQCWNVDEAIDWMIPLAKYNIKWIEEPTSPDDVLGHAKISAVVVNDCYTPLASIVVVVLRCFQIQQMSKDYRLRMACE